MSFSGGELPDPPKGSPGGIRAAARSLGQAGHHFHAVSRGLTSASGALQADWQGWAASSYLACSRGLATAVTGGATAFHSCEQAVSAYAGTLEHAQNEIKRLHGLWVAAKAREATARGDLQRLAGDLVTAKPSHVGSIEGGMNAAGDAETRAGNEAAHLVREAHRVLDTFHREAKRHASALEDQRPEHGPGALGAGASPFGGSLGGGVLGGPGFGVLPGGLSSLNGVIPVEHPPQTQYKDPGEWLTNPGDWGNFDKTVDNPYQSTNIPGFEGYWAAKNGHSPDALTSPDDLTNAVLFVAGGFAAKPLSTLLKSGAERLAARYGVGAAGRKAAADEGEAAFRKALTDYHDGVPFRDKVSAGLKDARSARIDAEIGQRGRLADDTKTALDAAERAGVKVPPGLKDMLPLALQHGGATAMLYRARALAWAAAAEGRGPATRAIAHRIQQLLGAAP